ncbi:MAG: SnoaL-like domain-containing protein [Sandaracinaceae bacterium]
MSAKEIGERFLSFVREGKDRECVETLYADDAVSVEAMAMGEAGRETKGKKAILGQIEWWYANHEIHDAKAEGPFPHGDDRFAVVFDVDVTQKSDGVRHKMREVAVYTLADGKIARAEYFYG